MIAPRLPALSTIVPLALLAACAGAPRAPTPPPAQQPTAPPFALAGTQWELVAVAAMDDAQGTTRIADPSRYTLRFGADGRASFRLDCNRGSGPWTATPAPDGRSGQLAFGPVAGTRALCPPPSLDTRVARDMGFVRSYRLDDGQLHLSLMADGGIYRWRPAAR